MIVHSKTLAELVEIMTRGQGELPITDWFFWVEALLVCILGLFWFYRLTISLALYDPLFIIPLMQACFILFGGVAGGIFFQEYRDLPTGRVGWGNWILYLMGFGCVIFGLYLVRQIPDPNDGSGGADGASNRSSQGAGGNDVVSATGVEVMVCAIGGGGSAASSAYDTSPKSSPKAGPTASSEPLVTTLSVNADEQPNGSSAAEERQSNGEASH